MIDVEAKRYGIDPLLVVAVIAVESEFDPQAVSHQGALGLMQVMPKWHLDRVDERVIGEAEERHLFDPGINISVGAELLAEALERHKSLEQALQYYNGATKDRGRRYARKVLSMYKRLHGIVQRHVAQTGMAGERAPRPAGGGEARG
ncbi:MAG: transglycosylase SLT domain-containing protein [Hydrogenophilus sp.]|nr:transglycosylase SLT domain-containing protein [Hydrogenophilus sp.]